MPTTPDSIAIVDYDCMCALGTTLADAWPRLAANESGIGLVDRFDVAHDPLFGVSDGAFGGQIPATYAQMAGSEARLKKWREPSIHALQSVFRQIVDRLRFNIAEHDPSRVAVIGGTALTSSIVHDQVVRGNQSVPNSMLCMCQNVPLTALAIEFGLQGPLFCIGSACASSGHALLLGATLLKAGVIDAAVICGFEFPFTPACVGSFVWLNAVYRRDNPADRAYDNPAQASRPFSGDRRGFLMAEGAGVALITRSDYAQKHQWPIKSLLRGGYMNSDGDGMTKLNKSRVQQCMTEALRASSTDLDDVKCINAHGTSTPVGDATELEALEAVFGHRLATVPVVANKSQIGHSLGATSILEIMFAAEGMKRGIVLPTLNHMMDPALPNARIPAAATAEPHDVTLFNAFGFGGTNISLVLERGCD